MDEMETKCDEDYDNGIQPLAVELIDPYKELDCDYINKRISEESNQYEQLVGILSNRLTDIESRSDVINSLLTDQRTCMTSLSEIDQQVDAIPVHSLSSSDVTKLLMELQVII